LHLFVQNIFSFQQPLYIPSLIFAKFYDDDEFVKDVPIYECRTTGESYDDFNLVNRIILAYQLVEKKHLGNSMWQLFYDLKFHPIHDVFQSGNLEEESNILRNPGQIEHFYGIDNICSSILPFHFTDSSLIGLATGSLDCLVRFGEAIGSIKLKNSETPFPIPRKWCVDEVLNVIESKLKITIDFPNPYPDEIGIYTSKGTASYRAIQALYQAYRIKELLKDIPNPRVLEIGSGLGRTAYYCRLFGIKDYTIIDLPMTVLASSYFLGRVVGESLDDSQNKIKILTPSQFINDTTQYDLIVNAASLTEMDINTIHMYLDKIQKTTKMFLSINHEINTYSVNELLSYSKNIKN
jgi:hypothetical protein